MKPRSFFVALALTVVFLLLTGAWGAYWLAANSPLKTAGLSLPTATIFMAQRSPLVVSVTNPDRLLADSFAHTPPLQRRALQREFQRFESGLFASVNYARDIQPWLGDEVVLSVTTMDLDRDSSNGKQPGYLLAIATNRPEQAQKSLKKIWQKRDQAATEEFLGVTITAGKELATALVGDRYVLLANHAKVVRDALNNVQASDQSLSQSQSFQDFVTHLPPEALGFAWMDLPQIAKSLGNVVPHNPRYDRMQMVLKLVPQGILAETTLLATDGSTPTPPVLSYPVDALKFIPENSAVMAAGTHVKQMWTNLEKGLGGYEAVAQKFLQPLLQRQGEWGVNLAEDVLNWMPGDYAFGVLPDQNWVFVTPQSQDTTAGLAQLNERAKTQGVSMGTFALGAAEITAWTKLETTLKPSASKTAKSDLMSIQAKVEGVHTTLDGYEIFATSLEAMEQAMQALPSASRRVAIATLEPRNNGYFAVDGATLRAWMGGTAGNLNPLLDRIASVTVSHYGSDRQGLRNGVLIQMTP